MNHSEEIEQSQTFELQQETQSDADIDLETNVDNTELSIEEKNYIEKVIEDMCQIKAEEMKLLGIRTNGKQIWLCVASTYKNGFPEFHQMVNDVLSLKSTKFMNWLIVQAQKGLYSP